MFVVWVSSATAGPNSRDSHIMGRAAQERITSGWLSARRLGTSSPKIRERNVMAATTAPSAMASA